MLKKFRDPSIVFLLITNLWCIYLFYKDPESFGTIVWIYWFQSILIGIFNFLDMITFIDHYKEPQLQKNPRIAQGCTGLFFLGHYTGFHLAYLLFLFKYKPNNWDFLLLTVAAFLLENIISFRRKKIYQKHHQVSGTYLFFIPYLRILPMHLMLLGPQLFNISPSAFFLVLKTFADIGFYSLTERMYKSNNK